MPPKFEIGDLVRYKIYAYDEYGNKTNDVLEEGEGIIENILSNGNLILDNEDYLIALPEECEKINIPKWQIKMQSIIEQVLGDVYSIEFVSETSIKVFNNNEYVLGRVTASETANHWQEQVKEIIHIIIDQNIKNAFNKLKHNDN